MVNNITSKTDAYRRYAILTVFLNQYSMSVLGEELCNVLSSRDKDIRVTDARETAMTLKRSRANSIDIDEVKKALVKAIRNVVDGDSKFESHILDTYEFKYDKDDVDAEFVDSTMAVDIVGRNIYIDMD